MIYNTYNNEVSFCLLSAFAEPYNTSDSSGNPLSVHIRYNAYHHLFSCLLFQIFFIKMVILNKPFYHGYTAFNWSILNLCFSQTICRISSY